MKQFLELESKEEEEEEEIFLSDERVVLSLQKKL